MKHLELNNREFQLEIVDVFSKVQEEVTAYRASFNQYQQLQKQLAQLEEQDAAATRDKDFKQFLLNELLEANLQPGEQEQTETELNTLNNAEDIQLALNTGVQLLREQENAAISMLQEVRTQFQRVAKFNPRIDDLFKRLDSSLIELKDIANEAEDIAQDISSDKQRQEVLTARLDLMYSLQKKHRCNTLEELHSIKQQLSTELENIDSLEAKIEQLKKEQSELHTTLLKTARQISDKRKKHIPALEKSINVLLQQVGMPNAGIQMKQDILPDAQLNLNGVDQLTLLFASNKGSAFQPLNKIASGGELSRLMLCIKTVVAHLTQLPTLIFDEIDTGISGETARQVGDVMKKLAEKHQVICITHLPQIAGKAHQHYFVYKESDSKTTHSNMRLLNSNERIEEIAKMLSGSKPTESALANARELVG
jgi:DNA repair protein RecN (Recombination protein N)